MKKASIIMSIAAALLFTGVCNATTNPDTFVTAQNAIDILTEGNLEYVSSSINSADISVEKRKYTSQNGQSPYAVIITCSDSRVPAEHIFNAGIGDLFVIRTAGNVIGDYELGSIEYGVEHLNTKLIVVLGHTQCGAVEAALSGGAHGYIKTITDEISSCLTENCQPRQGEFLNVQNSIEKIRTSEIIKELETSGNIVIKGAIYDIASGRVEFLD